MREAIAEQAAARVQRGEEAMTAAVTAYAERVAGVAVARLRGPKARRGTRYWSERVKDAGSTYQTGGLGPLLHIRTDDSRTTGVEIKAVDTEYVVPDSLVGEVVETIRPVALRVARDAAADAAQRLGVDVPDTSEAQDGMFAVDETLLADLLDEALEDMLGGAARYAQGLRTAILDGDAEGLELDDLLEKVGQAATRGGNWLRLSARTVGTALAGKASLEQARALGVVATQWLSRRDLKVRSSHVVADGQVRPINAMFDVGGFQLEYPGDPSGLPETMSVVAGCRCSLLLIDPNDSFWDALVDIAEAAAAGPDAAGIADTLSAAARAEEFVPVLDAPVGLPDLASAVVVPADVVGWRVLSTVLDVAPGQQVELPAGTVLGLSAPAALDAAVLAVLVPAGTAAGVTGGALVLTGPAVVTVLAAGAGGVQGRLTEI